jgi:hypothetical protein
MPAKSKKQRRLAAMTVSVKTSGGKPTVMMGMYLEDLKHYASGSEKGLPLRKKKK